MRICLIIPPSLFLLDERVFMTLGILRVAAVLEQAGTAVEVLDLSGVENYLEAVTFHIQRSDSQTFGITATTPQMPAATKIAARIRQHRQNAKIILGGPHVTLVNAAVKREEQRNELGRATKAFSFLKAAFDVLVCGDGELAIFRALEDSTSKVIDSDDPRSPFYLTNEKLNELPFPARHLVDTKSYHYAIDGEPALSLIAQLGCPFGCGFCGGRYSPMLRRIRTRTTDNIIQEMRQMYETYGTKGFMFYDDELNVNLQMIDLMNAIGNLQEDLGVHFKLRGFIKSQLFTDAQADTMFRAGFRWILTGFESGSPRILENINKRATREENTRCIDIARNHGLKVKALMSIGHPGESAETVKETEDWLLENKPDDFDVTIITTYPGTPYYDEANKQPNGDWCYTAPSGDKLYGIEVDYMKVADYYKGDPDGGYTSYVYTDFLTPKQLVNIRDDLERYVRRKLRIPFNPGAPSQRFEHSMGQTALPASILRTTQEVQNALQVG